MQNFRIMKSKILLLIIATFAIACNSQVENKIKNKGIIFKNEIFDLDNFKISLEKDTAKLNIVWNINNEPDNFSDAKDTIIISIQGIAPETNFSFDTICLGDSTNFIDLSTSKAKSRLTSGNFEMLTNCVVFRSLFIKISQLKSA